ncbi:MAG: pectinacetylesterase family protein [Deltaproteobacteria bacterium]|nr:pectinacetylesterase family protein [Deltaproteobacteria bacterium]
MRASWSLLIAVLVGCGANGGATVDATGASAADAPGDGAQACVDPPGTVVPPTFEKHTIASAVARNAVCNDGSPGIYYLRRGTGCGATRWVIGLEGGGSCSSDAECAARTQGLTSSIDKPATLTLHGIFDGDATANPDFFTSNEVYVDYCTSDNWAGHRAASAATNNFAFRGADLVRAVFEDLRDPAITGDANIGTATDVLLVGSSAGGLGVLANADRLATALPDAQVRALDDAGWVPDILGYAPPGEPGLPVYTEFDARFAYWGALPDDSCAALETADPGRCMIGPLLLPRLTVPLFVHQDQRDPVQLKMLGGNTDTAYKTMFAGAIKTSLGPVSGVFSPSAGDHGLVFSTDFPVRTLGGVTYREAVGNWYFARSGASHIIE